MKCLQEDLEELDTKLKSHREYVESHEQQSLPVPTVIFGGFCPLTNPSYAPAVVSTPQTGVLANSLVFFSLSFVENSVFKSLH